MRRPLPLLMALALVATGAASAADTLIAARMIRAETVLTAEDVARADTPTPGALSDATQAVGKETRVNVYAGQPLFAGDLGPPAIVHRNQIVTLNYYHAGLAIATEARSLDRGGVGARIRVMNLASRQTVTGIVMVDGTVSVAPE